MRGLIAAEEYKRKHGDYPDAMPDLPLDPFSGKPLLYRKGLCSYRMTQVNREKYNCSIYCSDEHWRTQTEVTDTRIPAVQVWSVGPDRVDDGGIGNPGYWNGDIRAILRLKP